MRASKKKKKKVRERIQELNKMRRKNKSINRSKYQTIIKVNKLEMKFASNIFIKKLPTKKIRASDRYFSYQWNT